MPQRPPPDDDPKFLARASALRKAPRAGEVVGPRSGPRGDEDEADDGPLPQDIERFSGVTRKCPECGKEVFDDSAVCYHCGHAFERTAAGSGRVPLWIVGTVIALVAAFALAHVAGLI